MAKVKTEDIRNVALVGHGDSGKTTLSEAMLFAAGATKRMGDVDEGTSVSDFDPEEKERQSSISTAVLHLGWKGMSVNLVDAPGYPDYVAEAIEALRAVETAVVCIAASAGIGVNTRKMWTAAEKEGLARIIVITRMAGDNVDFEGLMEQVREVFGNNCVPMTLPVGQGKEFKGVVNVVKVPAEVPAGVVGDVQTVHDNLMETALEADDALLERYLEGQTLTDEELARVLREAVATGTLVPVLVTEAKHDLGVKEFLDAVVEYAPSPLTGVKRTVKTGEKETELNPDAGASLVGQVFKIVTDPFVGKLCYVRVYSGHVAAEGSVTVSRTGDKYKVNQVLRVQGKEQTTIPEAPAGEIVAIPKLESARQGDTLSDGTVTGTMVPMVFPEPMVSLAVEPKSRGDEQKISGTLAKLAEEDPTFRVSRDKQTGEMVISGVSTLHLDVMLGRMKRRFNVEVNTKQPRIPYLETVTATAEGHHRHKKQTGGRGQFGEVYVRIEPQERGKGFEFADEVVGGSVPNNFIPAVEKGVREACDKGIIAGFPVVDVKVALYDGKDHPVDSSEAAFKIAGARAFGKGVEAAKPVLLEPIANIEITIPSNFLGDITGDLNSRRGRITGMDTAGGLQIVKAQVPMAEVLRYATELRSITGGQGSYTLEFSHYDVVPSNIAAGIIAQHKKTVEEEED